MEGYKDIRLTSNYQSIICLVLSFTGFVLNAVAYYPGFMSSDSFDQYSQALTNQYHDWHPPVMAGVWHFLLLLYKGPQPMFFLQLFLLWTSFYVISRIFIKQNFYALLAVLLFIYAPFVLNFAGVIWKDTQMALAWLLATALMLRALIEERSLKRTEIGATFLLLSYGCWLRFNALPGVIPLVGLFVFLCSKREDVIKWPKLIGKTGVVLVFIYLLQQLLNYTVMKAERVYPENKIYMQDITGIYVTTGKNYYPYFITSYPGYDSAYLKKNYNTATFDHIWWNFDGKDLFPAPLLVYHKDSSKVLRNQWLKAIMENPGVYLKNRYSGFLYYLRIKERTKLFYSEYPYIAENNLGIEFKPNAISNLFIKAIHVQKDYFYMKPWFWALSNILMLFSIFLNISPKARKMILTLGLSGTFYLLPQFFVFQIDTDFRYFYWNCLSVSLCLIILIYDLIAGKDVSVSSQPFQKGDVPEYH